MAAEGKANAAWWAITALAFNLNPAMKQLGLGKEWVSGRLKAAQPGLCKSLRPAPT